MRGKKKITEKINYIFPDEILDYVQSEGNCCDILKCIQDLMFAADGINQINALKEVHRILSSKISDLTLHEKLLEILCTMFYQSPLKSSHKKAVHRILVELSETYPEKLTTLLKESLELNMTASATFSVKEIDKIVNCILGLLDNFPIGKKVINEHFLFVWKTTSDILIAVLNFLRVENSLQKTTELYSLCQSVLKMIILTFQNCEKNLFVQYKEDINFTSASENIKKSLDDLLMSDKTFLNCRLNAAIAWCYFNYFCDKNKFKMEILSEEDSFQAFKKFPCSSCLCIFSGIMAVFPPNEFIVKSNSFCMVDKIVHEVLNISKSANDPELLLLCVRDLIQWTNVLGNILSSNSSQVIDAERIKELRYMLSENRSLMKLLFEYIVHHREHFIDSLRHLCRDLFKSLLNLHILTIDIEASQSPLIKELTLFLLKELPYHNRGKYGLISCIVEIIGTEQILIWHPSLPEELYKALTEVSLVTHISDVCENLFKHSSVDELNFQHVWLNPLLKCLCSGSKEQMIAMDEHIFPKLLKVKPFSIHFLMSELSYMWENNIGNCFSALISCVKFSEKLKISKSNEMLSTASLMKALCHADDQIRLSAFSLLCETQKTTAPVPFETLKLIKFGLPCNINCQSPSFRQQLISYMKKLFFRIAESSYALKKKETSNAVEYSNASSILRNYKDFLCWLKKYLYSCLHPGANFPCRVTTLNLLFLLNSILQQSVCLIDSKTAAETLLYALQDTYENNKLLVMKILSSSKISSTYLEDERFRKSLFQTALILASSAKPPDTVTAAYMYAFMVQCENFYSLIFDNLLHLIKLGFCPLQFEKESAGKIHSSILFITILMLMCELIKQLELAQENLLEAAIRAPLYGILTCIRSVLHQVKFSDIEDPYSLKQWHDLILELITLCIKVASSVEPVVCNSSPEGHLPMDADHENITQLQAAVRRAIGCRFQSALVQPLEQSSNGGLQVDDAVVLDFVKTHAVTAQMLLLCCWRTHKEISLLFGEIAELVPIFFPEVSTENGILNATQVEKIGEYFTRQMSLVKHKGAFEQAYIGFSKLCSRLWRSHFPKLQELPKVWLGDLLLAIRGLKENMQLCPTRRSAGLPFIIQALLASEPGIGNSSFFKETMSIFLSLAEDENQNNSDTQVHALNILRALFRDANLGEVVMPFVSQGLKISVLGFKSLLWAVRNSSTLLFSALMIRIFGVNRSHDEAGKKNRLTGKTFFSNYKDMYFFLHDELEQCVLSFNQSNTRSISTEPTMYPILLILGRLYPAAGESDPRLASFIPLLHKCACSPVWKTRILAAKALVPLISIENVTATLQSLFCSIPSVGEINFSNNMIHGLLLQILYILKECLNIPPFQRKGLECKLQLWISSHFDVMLRSNACYSIRAAFMEILIIVMMMNIVPLDFCLMRRVLDAILTELEIISIIPDKDHYLTFAVVYVLFQMIQLQNLSSFNMPLCTSSEHRVTGEMKCQNEISASELSTLILKFLECDVGVVRYTTIQLLIWIYQDGCVFPVRVLDSSADNLFLRDLSNSVSILIEKYQVIGCESLQNVNYCESITKILGKESNFSYIGKIYELMCVTPNAVTEVWEFIHGRYNSHQINKLEYILSHLKACRRDDVSCYILLFSAQLVLCICSGLDTNAEKEESLNVVEKWLLLVEEFSQPENSMLKRQAVVSTLSVLSESSLFKSSILESKTSYLWQALLNLLIDDEPEIKNSASKIVASIKGSEFSDTRILCFVPSVALDDMMGLFLKANYALPSYCTSMLLNWMLSCQMDSFDNMGDEQPFDKGEMNVFAEDLLVTKLASKHISEYFSSLKEEECFILIDKISCWKSQTQKGQYTLSDALNFCVSDANAIAERIINRKVLSPFLDSLFEQDIIQICQRIQVIISLVPFSKTLLGFKSQAKKLIQNIEKLDYRTFYFDSVLSKLHLCIEAIND